MQSVDIVSKITTCSVIDHCGNYSLFVAKKCSTYNHLTGKTNKHPEIHPYAHKHIFLPGDNLFVQGGGDSMYHLISLQEGRVKDSVLAPRKRIMKTFRFAVSPDGNKIYDIWKLDDKVYVVEFTTEPLSFRMTEMRLNLRSVWDIICTEDNDLLVLQSQVDSDDEGNWTKAQIVSVDIDGNTCKTEIIREWRLPIAFRPFRTDGRFVLHYNLDVLDLTSGEVFSLVEKTEVPFTQENGPTNCKYYPEYKILQLFDGREDTFVDCSNRKIIAKYFTKHETYQGALVDGEYWCGTKQGIIRKKFPLFEEIPPITLSERLGRY